MAQHVLGFVEAGEGGAPYMTPDGQESVGWDGPRELVLAELGRLIERGTGSR